MKLKWREHELMLVSLLSAIGIAGYCWRAYTITDQEIKTLYLFPAGLAREFEALAASRHIDHPVFKYTRDVLMPQVLSVLLLFAIYFLASRVVFSSVKELWVRTPIADRVKRAGWIIIQAALLSYLLALGINILSYFALPHLYNYTGFTILAMLGYNDHPLSSIWISFERALPLLAVFGLYATVRELIIFRIEKKGVQGTYRSMIINEISTMVIVVISISYFLFFFDLASDDFFRGYFYATPPMLILFMYNIYSLFPSKGATSFFNRQLISRLLVWGILFLIPFLILFGRQNLITSLWVGLVTQFFVATPLSWSVYLQKRDKIQQWKNMETALVKSTTDLQFLRSQINPHFLFNALNTLYGTALLEKSERTAEGIQKLGDMMRFMLDENYQDLIAMNKEIEYLENYISLQKLRTQSSSAILIEQNIAKEDCHHQIAPMLLIPFVENAFKHGISLVQPSWIKIKLYCDERAIHFEVRNSIHSLKANDTEKERSGIGLANVIQRLNLLYPGKHEFNYRKNGNEFVVNLSIQS